MLVHQCMTPDPFVVSSHEPVNRIAELIRRRGIKQVPVVDIHNHLVGIVTDRDIRSAVAAVGAEDIDLLAGDIMSTDLVTIAPYEELSDAARLLCRHEFGALPVVVGERVVGILTVRDLLRRMVDLLEKEKAESDQFRPTSNMAGTAFKSTLAMPGRISPRKELQT